MQEADRRCLLNLVNQLSKDVGLSLCVSPTIYGAIRVCIGCFIHCDGMIGGGRHHSKSKVSKHMREADQVSNTPITPGCSDPSSQCLMYLPQKGQ